MKYIMHINKICTGQLNLVLQTRSREHIRYRRFNSPMDDISLT